MDTAVQRIVWHKPNPMPESVTDRPTNAYEMVFLLAKSGTAQFWTHRELPGQRTAPDPDYRWQDALTGMEYSEEPEAYTEDMIPCPECGGEGSLTKQVGQVSMFDGIPEMVRECGKCKGEGEVKRWKRVNLWQSHDYFYDAEAVREPAYQGICGHGHTARCVANGLSQNRFSRHDFSHSADV